jgi:hypothetical protein
MNTVARQNEQTADLANRDVSMGAPHELHETVRTAMDGRG